MKTRKTHNRHKLPVKTSTKSEIKGQEKRGEYYDAGTVRVQKILTLAMSDQISYHWLFGIDFHPPLEHATLPFLKPIPQEVNN